MWTVLDAFKVCESMFSTALVSSLSRDVINDPAVYVYKTCAKVSLKVFSSLECLSDIGSKLSTMSAEYRCRTASHIDWRYGPWLLESLKFLCKKTGMCVQLNTVMYATAHTSLPKTWLESHDH